MKPKEKQNEKIKKITIKMKNILKIFTALFLTLNIMPVFGAGVYVDFEAQAKEIAQTAAANAQTNDITNTNAPKEKTTKEKCNIENALTTNRDKDGKCHVVSCKAGYKRNEDKTQCVATDKTIERQTNKATIATTTTPAEISTSETGTTADKNQSDELDKKQAAYDEAKANEQSRENRMLTAATTAATGIGGMELAMGLSEQKADKDAQQDMGAYIATFRCEYGNGKSVKAGADEIELPGGNDQNMMNYRAEYFSLANDLKERKSALGMKPGIESEEILDKSQMGLYDDENTGITDGAYASLYRAQMLNSEKDQQQIDEEAKKSKTRVIAGGVAAGVGVVGGAVGDSLINGKLGELIKEKKDKNADTKENQDTIESLKSGLKSAGMSNVDKLDLSNFDMSGLKDKISNIDWTKINLSDKDALTDINTSNITSLTSSFSKLNIFGQ